MYQSNDCAFGDNKCVATSDKSGHGIEVTFSDPISFVDLIIQTRKSYEYRYLGVCLYADDDTIACTPDSNYNPDFINFADLTLKWEGTSTYAQIAELSIKYADGML